MRLERVASSLLKDPTPKKTIGARCRGPCKLPLLYLRYRVHLKGIRSVSAFQWKINIAPSYRDQRETTSSLRERRVEGSRRVVASV